MKLKELIEKLKEFDGETEVVINADYKDWDEFEFYVYDGKVVIDAN